MTEKEMIEKYKKLYVRRIGCDFCKSLSSIKYDYLSCNNYCNKCLEKHLLEDIDALAESISDEEDFNY